MQRSTQPRDPHLEALDRAAVRLLSGDARGTETALHAFAAGLDVAGAPADLTAFLFAAALERRARSLGDASREHAVEANLYLRDFDVPQIRLFDLLVTQVPTVALAYEAANAIIARVVEDRDHLVLVDIGVGTGRQETELFARLAENEKCPRAITVIGVDPDEESLRLAALAIEEAGIKHGIATEFRPVHRFGEDLSADDWSAMGGADGALVVNAAFALHHVGTRRPDGTRSSRGHAEARAWLLSNVAALRPRAVVLSEPNSDHDEPDLRLRLANAWNHFGRTFRLIDALDLDARDKAALKVCFFGREIDDILGTADSLRAERHEPLTRWVDRLESVGLALRDVGGVSVAGRAGLVVSARGGVVSFDDAEGPLVGVVCAALPRGRVPTAPPVRVSVMSSHPPGSTRTLDVTTLLRALIAVAKADEVIADVERTFIEGHARVFGVDTTALWNEPSDLAWLATAKVPRRTAHSIVRDCVLLANVDGEYHPSERDRVFEIGTRLGLPHDEVLSIEREASTCTPPLLADAPAELRELWALRTSEFEG